LTVFLRLVRDALFALDYVGEESDLVVDGAP